VAGAVELRKGPVDAEALVGPEPSSHVAVAASRASQERFELKYWVPERLTHTVAEFGQSYLRIDPYHDEHAIQRNTSLYLDTASLELYRAHVDSAPDRAKLRVRVYGEQPSGLAFFEFKRKVRSVIVKRRAPVPIEQAAAVLGGDYAVLGRMRPEYRRNLEAFLYYQNVYRAEPAFLVTCLREAYASEHGELDDVRMTIDREVAYQPAVGVEFQGYSRGWLNLSAPPARGSERMALVELKFRGLAPLWMRQLVELLKMERIAFSKYVSSVTMETELRPLAPAVAESIWT
jgi:hypothetical protein